MARYVDKPNKFDLREEDLNVLTQPSGELSRQLQEAQDQAAHDRRQRQEALDQAAHDRRQLQEALDQAAHDRCRLREAEERLAEAVQLLTARGRQDQSDYGRM